MLGGLITVMAAMAVIGGGGSYFMLPTFVKMGLDFFVDLSEGGMVYPLYMNPPFPSKASYWIYEITNPKQVLQGGKMEFNLRGPYKYDSYIKRDNIAFKDKGERVKFDSHRLMYLDEEHSADLDKKFWMLNPVLVSTQITVKNLVLDRLPFARLSEPIVYNTVNVLLDNYKERLIAKKAPREILQGTKIQLLESITGLADRFGLTAFVPPGPPENTFGVAHFQNVTVETVEVYTGVGSTKKRFGEVISWRNQEKMTIWKGKCNIINGTNGELYKSFPDPNKPIKVFLPQLCRSFTVDPVQAEPVEVQDGLMAYEFQFSPKLYLGARSNPKNKCFCKDTRTYDCQYDGFLPMGPCFYDAPLFFTKANMKVVDKRMRRLVDEATVEYDLPDKQSFYLEPYSGTVLKLNLTLLATFKMVRQPYMRDLANVQNLTYAPFFVASEFIELPSQVTLPLQALQLLMKYYKPLFFVVAVGGSLVLVLRFIIWGRSGGEAKRVSPES